MKMDEFDYEASIPLPIANPDLFGHAEAEAKFLDSFNSGRLPHAWLISGPPGIGKATLAYRIARFVLTRHSSLDKTAGLFGDNLTQTKPTSLAVDITNPICRRIFSGGHADFLSIERSIDEKTGKKRKEIRVDEVRNKKDGFRNIARFLSKTPAEGGWRVIIIDSADDLNTWAANTVLKTLEEPPKRVLLILVSNNPAKLLPTIHSRCRRLTLNLLPAKTINKFLQKYNPQMTSDDLNQLVEIADGSIGRALEFSKDGGLDIFREVNGILSTLPQLDIPRLHHLGDKLNRDKSGKVSELTFDIISRWLVNVIKDLAKNDKRRLDRWIEVWENTGRLINDTKRLNLDPKQVILNTFIAIKSAANH